MRESRFNVWVEEGEEQFVFNGVSGTLLAIPAEKLPPLKQFIAGTDVACDYSLLVGMAESRMLVPDDHDELEALRDKYEDDRNDSRRLGLTIIPSLGCNFDCPYCFEDKPPSVMPQRVQQAVVELVERRAPTLEGFGVTWFGGEPLIGKKVIERLSGEFQRICSARHIPYGASIITNGHLLDRETALLLRRCDVGAAQVTLDGPPHVHDTMRPLISGKGTFWTILRNIVDAAEIINISVRVNLAQENKAYYQELLELLADEGLADKVSVSPGHLVMQDAGYAGPASSCALTGLTMREYAQVDQEFTEAAQALGFSAGPSLRPEGAPCTAVRNHDLVIGSLGEIYKCWADVGNPQEVAGHIVKGTADDERASKWLRYDPFANDDCRNCIALPVCMGGCAHHAMIPTIYESRCGTFRFKHTEQVRLVARAAQKRGISGVIDAQTVRRLAFGARFDAPEREAVEVC